MSALQPGPYSPWAAAVIVDVWKVVVGGVMVGCVVQGKTLAATLEETLEETLAEMLLKRL